MTILTNGIDWGSRLSGEAVTYFFAPPRETYATPVGRVTTEKWTAYEKQQFAEALATFETFTNLDFTEASSRQAADLTLVNWAGGANGPLGVFGPPGTKYAGTGAFNDQGRGWDGNPGGGLEQGGYGFITVIHEVGHGLGLAHPHDRGGTSTVFPGVTRDFGDYGQFDLNQGIHTMMSYNDGWPTAPHGISPSDDYGYEGTPMAVDIAVLQDKYGANGSYNRGDDNYTLPTANASGTFYSCLWDAGGIDTIRAGATGRNAVIDLHDATLRAENGGGGFVSYARGIHGGFTIANGVVIENAVGGRGDDRLTGNEAGNVLEGGDGDDRLTGGLGRDVLTGAADHDTFVFEAVRDSRAGSGIDRITDFDRADEIDLTDIDWSGERGDQAFTFVDGRLSEAGELRIRQAGGDTFLEAEVNGAGDADLVIRLDGLVAVREGDLLL